MKLSDVARLIGAEGQLGKAVAVEPTGFSIDSRTIRPGDLFFAIQGSTRDAHEFVGAVLEKGACGAVISQEPARLRLTEPHPPLLKVHDTLEALQTLARRVRESWGGTVVGITGSAGKTQTKELTACLLETCGARAIKTLGNYNNAYGLPLSLLQLASADMTQAEIKYAVVEMGMNAPGEIAHLCTIAQPDVGVITNVSSAHLEFFRDVEAIAEAKAELVDHVKEDGVVILNMDDPLVARMRFRRLVSGRTYGIDQPADVMALEIQSLGLNGSRFKLRTPRGVVSVEFPLLGRHNIYNALAAATVGDYLHLPLEMLAEGLSQARVYSMRGEVIRFARGFTVINDAYNSNPRALREMIATLRTTNSVARRIVVAGEMLELGPRGPELHRECGREMARRGIDLVIGVRGLAREFIVGARQASMSKNRTYFFETPEAAARLLFDNLQTGDLVLVKGSRGVRMERLIEELNRLCDAMG